MASNIKLIKTCSKFLLHKNMIASGSLKITVSKSHKQSLDLFSNVAVFNNDMFNLWDIFFSKVR